ncbi:uncharacterized protein PG998_006800 [Apiospora kogelbergensis]|uniref:uncharacterized protein n=1 Tax=Apiospora kogelbergensis TaxID=1337665 RepID=UPI0031326FB0
MESYSYGFSSWLARLAGLTFALAVYLALHRRFWSPLALVPGPRLASITRLCHAYHIFKGDNSTWTRALHKQYGHFVRIAPNEVSVSHPDGPALILQASLRKGNWYRVFSLPDYRYVNTPSILDPKERAQRTRLFAPAFLSSNLLQSEPRFDAVLGQLFGRLDAHAAAGRPLHLDRQLSFAALDVAGEALFARPFGFAAAGRDLDGHLAKGRAANCYAAVAGNFWTLHRLLAANPLITRTGLLAGGHVMRSTFAALRRAEAKATDADAPSSSSVVDHWTKAGRDNPEVLRPVDVEAQIIITVGAASDTVSCAIQSFVYHMIANPTSWARAREEIESQRAQGFCKDPVVSYQDSQTLPYLRACLHESIRMFGPSPMGLARVAPAGGLSIGGQHFPEGTTLSINPNVMQQSKECWGEDAEEWNPDRWFAEDISSKLKYWMAFGLGGNKCPGENLARIELFKVAATLVRDYSIRQVDPENKWQWEGYITRVPHSWPVYVEKRGV